MARVGLVLLAILAGLLLVMQARAEEAEASASLAAHSESIAEEPSHSMQDPQVAEGPSIRKLGQFKHHRDKSVAGGDVIIGGLVTAIFAAVFCYIRVTRKRGAESNQEEEKAVAAVLKKLILQSQQGRPEDERSFRFSHGRS